MAGKNEHNPYGDEHPFDKVFDQIEQLMKVLDANKDKPPKEIPPFIEEELNDVEEVVKDADIGDTPRDGNKKPVFKIRRRRASRRRAK